MILEALNFHASTKVSFLFDGNNLLYRSAWANAKDGEPTWSTKTMAHTLSTVRGVLHRYRPDHAFFVWDGGRSRRRIDLHPEYKRTEKRKLQQDFSSNLRKASISLTGYMRKMGIRVLSLPGRECDDIIAHLVHILKGGTVVSEDRDFLQLVIHGANIYQPYKDKYINRAFFAQEFHGITPEQFLLARAMVGDTSDNIDGVPGIGFITASKLLAQMPEVRTCDELLQAIGRLPKKGKKLTGILLSEAIVRRNLELIDASKEILASLEEQVLRHSIEGEVRLDPRVQEIMQRDGVLAHIPVASWDHFVLPFKWLT